MLTGTSGLALDWSTEHRSSWHLEHDWAILAPASSLWALPMLLGIIKKTNALCQRGPIIHGEFRTTRVPAYRSRPDDAGTRKRVGPMMIMVVFSDHL